MQRKIIEAISQIYKYESLVKVYGEEEADRLWSLTVHEVVCMIGKGGGKDFSSRVGFAYAIYKLHCLRDPIEYYGKAHGTYIDFLNIAVNADQARNVFFEPLTNMLRLSPYFQEKGFEPRKNELKFHSCPIRIHSGNSEAEAWEGLDLLLVVLDEIAAFKADNQLRTGTGGAQRLSASAIYKMSKLSVMSRFPELGKVVLLSFTRYVGDFIMQRYEESASEDHVLRMKATTWEANPMITREMLEPEYKRNPIDARARFESIVAGERVWTTKGLLPIEDIRPGDMVATRYGPKRALAAWSQPEEKECIRLTFNTGQALSCSTNHPLAKITKVRTGRDKHGVSYAEKLGKYETEWRHASDLNIGDEVLSHYGGPHGDNMVSYDEAYLLGLISSDGYVNDKYNRIGISCGKDSKFAKEISDLLLSTFGSGYVSKQPGNRLYPECVTYQACAGAKSAVQKVISLGMVAGAKSHAKRVPHSIFGANEDAIRGFLNGYIDGDGSLRSSGNKGQIQIVSTSYEMLLDLQELFGGLGHRGLISLNRKADTAGKIRSNHDLYVLRFNKYDSLRVWDWMRLKSYKRNAARPDAFTSEGKGIHQNLKLKIVNIENIGLHKVYDVTVEDVEEFVCNSVVVHNCAPPEMVDSFFRDPMRVRKCFKGNWELIDLGGEEKKLVLKENPDLNPIDDEGRLKDWFKCTDNFTRYIHVDLGLKRDRAALCMVHSPGTRKVEVERGSYEPLPVIKMDLIHYWEALPGQEIDFQSVREFIKLLALKFPVGMVTFDRWQSLDMIQILNKRGIYSENHSIKKNDYDSLATAFYDGRFTGYFHKMLVEDELLKLQTLPTGKVDHPDGFHDDLAQALAGACWHAVQFADTDADIEISVLGEAEDWENIELADALEDERQKDGRVRPHAELTYDESDIEFDFDLELI